MLADRVNESSKREPCSREVDPRDHRFNARLALFEEAGDVGGQGWAHLGISETWAEEDYRRVLEYQRLAHQSLAQAGQTVGRSLGPTELGLPAHGGRGL